MRQRGLQTPAGREINKQAARRCREKKAQLMQELQDKVRTLAAENTRLKQEAPRVAAAAREVADVAGPSAQQSNGCSALPRSLLDAGHGTDPLPRHLRQLESGSAPPLTMAPAATADGCTGTGTPSPSPLWRVEAAPQLLLWMAAGRRMQQELSKRVEAELREAAAEAARQLQGEILRRLEAERELERERERRLEAEKQRQQDKARRSQAEAERLQAVVQLQQERARRSQAEEELKLELLSDTS